MKIGVFTIASKNYVSYVRTLFASMARVHPEYTVFLCLADRLDGLLDPEQEPFTIVEAERLGVPHFGDFALRYDIMEFNTAVKPFMFRWLFDNTDLDAVIYLDPDILAYSRFTRLEMMLTDGASVVLTPHITRPLEDGKTPSDFSILKAGVFNLGFIAARRCSETLDFMNWWGRRLLTQCISDQPANLFVDQKWCDLAPCLLDNLAILKDVGYNAAYWNLAQRHVAQADDGRWVVNESPLTFFHFSGIVPSDKFLVSKYQDRFTWDDIPSVQPLFEAYNDALMQAGWRETHELPYGFDALADGQAIRLPVRMLYREEHPVPIHIDAAALRSFLNELCNQPSRDVPADDHIRISKLMYLVYRRQPDLQSAFSMHTPDGRRGYASWFEEAALAYGLSPDVTQQHLISR